LNAACCGRRVEAPLDDAPVIDVDNVAAAFDAVGCQARLGRCRVAHICGPTDNVLTSERRASRQKAVEAAGKRPATRRSIANSWRATARFRRPPADSQTAAIASLPARRSKGPK
jgi:DNA-binding LacI/PurR family transcriptional regulator